MRITNCFTLKATNTSNVILQVKTSDKDLCYIVSFTDANKALELTAKAGDLPTRYIDLDIEATETTITINGTSYTANKVITLE